MLTSDILSDAWNVCWICRFDAHSVCQNNKSDTDNS
jgi:hypothetical protein